MSGLFKRSVPPLLIAAFCALVIGACFSPWKGDTGTLLINIGSGSGRALFDIEKEPATLEHEVILRGPGGTITRKFPGTGAIAASFELAAGTWDLTVRAVGKTPAAYREELEFDGSEWVTVEGNLFPPRILRAYGWSTVEIKAGQSSSARVDMTSATEVRNYEQLKRALSLVEVAELEIILVAGDIELGAYDAISIDSGGNIMLLADENVTISQAKDRPPSMSMIQMNTGTLTLGRPGMRGQLIFDGGGASFSSLPIVNTNSCELIMNDGVTLRNGGYSAVWVDGYYYMPDIFYGTFTMNGGTISGNTGFSGGGVYVGEYGKFDMNGGTISGNIADAGMDEGDGGGVYVESGGSFTKKGGTIYGNEPGINPILANIAGSGNGHAVFAQGYSSAGTPVTTIPDKGRNATAGPDVDLELDETGAAGGWDWEADL